MKALVYRGVDNIGWDDAPEPQVIDATDAIVRVHVTTICGFDLRILKGTSLRSRPVGSSATRPSGPSNVSVEA